MPERRSTDDGSYTERLLTSEGSTWKRLLGAQLPYRANIRRVVEGRVLDVGCGIGRNLGHLDGNGVGVDTNVASVEIARGRGLEAYTVSEFLETGVRGEEFETLLFAHVLEHMTLDEAGALVNQYMPFVRPGGRIVVIVPQDAGFASDDTHVAPVGEAELAEIAIQNRLAIDRIYSFPLPRFAGRWFRHNETVAVMTKPVNSELGDRSFS